MGVLSQFSNPGSSIETVTRAQAAPEPVKSEAAAASVTETTSAPAASETKSEDSSKGDDFDDFINGLDL